MRSSLLLACLLAVVSVRSICLALYPRTHMNQFVHSLYPRPPPVLNLLEGLPLLLLKPFLCQRTIALMVSWIAYREHTRFTSLSRSGPVTPDDVYVLQTAIRRPTGFWGMK